MPTKTVVERLVIEIAGDSRKFKSELKNLQQAERGFEGTMKNMAVVGKASFLAIGAAAATLGVVATKAFADFETGITNVAKTTNLEGQELEKFKNEIISLSEEIPVTTDKLLEIATAAGQLGIKGTANLTKFTEVIAKLGKTTNVDGEEAALTIARLLNLTNESIESVDKLGSTLVDLGNNFAATEAEILEVSKDVAKATVQFGLSSDEILGISAAMASLGIAAEAGGTVVGKAFQSIDKAIRAQGGPAFEKIIELTGLTGDALTETFAEDASKVFEMFIQGLGKAGKGGKDLTAEMSALGLSGIRVNKILPSLSSRSDLFSSAMDRAAGKTKNLTALQEEFAKSSATTSSKLIIAQTKINNTLIALGEQIAPNTIESIDLLSDSIRRSGALWRTVGNLISGVAGSIAGFIKFWAVATELIDKGFNSIKKLREANREDASEESKFLAGELKKRGVTWGRFSIFQRMQRKKAAKQREQEVKKSEKEVTKIIKKEDKAKIDQAEDTKERLLEIERSSLEGIRRVNEAEINLARAQRRGASQQEIDSLQRKFDAIKRITRLEQSILKVQNQEDISDKEQLQIDHSTNLLEIEQANYNDLLNAQGIFEANSVGEFEQYKDEVQRGFDDDPLTIGIETETPDGGTDNGGTDDGGGTTDGGTDGGDGFTFEVPPEDTTFAESLCNSANGNWHAPTKTCCSSGYQFDEAAGGCQRITTGTTTGDTGSGGLPGGETGLEWTGAQCAAPGEVRLTITQRNYAKPAGWTADTNGSLPVWRQPCCAGLVSGSFFVCEQPSVSGSLSPSLSSSSPSLSSNLPSGNISSPTVSSSSSSTTAATTGTQPIYIEIAFADGAIDFITAKQVEKTTLGI